MTADRPLKSSKGVLNKSELVEVSVDLWELTEDVRLIVLQRKWFKEYTTSQFAMTEKEARELFKWLKKMGYGEKGACRRCV